MSSITSQHLPEREKKLPVKVGPPSSSNYDVSDVSESKDHLDEDEELDGSTGDSDLFGFFFDSNAIFSSATKPTDQ